MITLLSEQDLHLLKKALTAIINSTAGLKNAIIIDETGITIANQSKFTFTDADTISVEKIGAIAGAVFTASEEQGEILGYGGINIQISEFDKGMLFLTKVGSGALILATDLNVQVGFIKAILKKYSPKITVILRRYLQTDHEGLKEELKELFGSDIY